MFPPIDDDDRMLMKLFAAAVIGLLMLFTVIGIYVRCAGASDRQLADSQNIIRNGGADFGCAYFQSPFIDQIDELGRADSGIYLDTYMYQVPTFGIGYYYTNHTDKDTVVCKVNAPETSLSVIGEDTRISKFPDFESALQFLKGRGYPGDDL